MPRTRGHLADLPWHREGRRGMYGRLGERRRRRGTVGGGNEGVDVCGSDGIDEVTRQGHCDKESSEENCMEIGLEEIVT